MFAAAAILASALAVVPAIAQQQEQQPAGQAPQKQLEEVTVTGTRILSRDNTSNSPIVTVNASQFQQQNGLNFESYLNKLPQYNPAAAPTVLNGPGSNSDVQITPVNSVGIASISLRGFGPNRSLVLVDGKRTVPINALMVTDVNSIPSALVQRVETITGGASAVYGADAVAGVTNFILKDNFEGFQFDAQYGNSSAGDGEERRISAVFGMNSDNGKGNIAIGFEHYDRSPALQVNRDIYTKNLHQDPYAAGTFGFLQGTTHYNCLFNCPTATAVNAVFNPPANASVFSPVSGNFFRQFVFNADGSLFVSNSATGLAHYSGGPNWTFYPSKIFDASVPDNTSVINGLKWYNQRALVEAPQQRYSVFSTGHYDFNDNLSVYARATVAQSQTRTVLFGTNAIFGWEGLVPYVPATDSPISPSLDYTNQATVAAAIADPTNPLYRNPGFIPTGQAGAQHPVPVQLAALLNSRPAGTYCITGSMLAPNTPCGAFGTGTYPNPNPLLDGVATTGDWLPGWSPDSSLPPRSTIDTNTQYQVEAGLNFKVGSEWTGEFYLSHGESSAYGDAAGNLSLTRYRALIAQPDYGRNAALQANSNGASPGFGGAKVTCTSGFYNTFFGGDAPLSQDCFQAVNADLQTRAENKQDIAELNFEGLLATIKPGEIRAAFGYQHRYNSATFVPDILQSTASFTDQVIGVYPTGYLDASTKADDIYMEVNVPLISNKKGFRRLELNLGARRSHYEHTKNDNTWKSLINWEINDWFRLRGGFNRATRAPNLGELFLNPQEIFTIGGNNYGDPCGLRSTAPFGAGGTGPDPVVDYPGEPVPQLASGQTPAGAQSARMICEAMMGPTAANQFYNVANAASGGGSAFNWVYQTGNTGLTSETANTWTFGFVMNLPFKKPLLSDITMTLDAYRIKIDNAITLYSVDYANYLCFGAVQVTTPAEAQAQAQSRACQLVPRNQALGGPLTTSVSYSNQAKIATEGADIALNWRVNFADLGSKIKGGLGFNMQANLLDYYRTKQSPANFDVETEWKGSLGPNLTGTNGGAYDYRLFSTLTYFRSAWSVNLRWRALPSVWSAAYASQQAIKENNARVAAGGPGIVLSYVPGTGPTASPEIKTDSYRIFDLSFNYNINKISIRGGITNLLDTNPPHVGSTAGYSSNLGGVCGGAPGCVNPNSYVLPSTGDYNGGYYDLLGRSYFVGVNFTF